MKVDILRFLRPLGFGGLLGSGVAYLAYLKYPELFAGRATLEAVMVFGSLLGVGLQRAVDAVVVQGLLRPFGQSANYYAKLAEVKLLKRNGFITEQICSQIEDELTRKYFGIQSDKHAERKELQPTKEPVKD